jgi:hypothetical protein
MMSAKTPTMLLLLCASLLVGCGLRTSLKPQKGVSMPVKPLIANNMPTSDQLLTPEPQARPKRSDEQLKQSENRRDDPFDLPPT